MFNIILPGEDGESSISSGTVDVITATYQVTPDSLLYESTLTETLASSLLFANGDDTYKIQIVESTEITSTARDNLRVSLTLNALRVKDREYRLYENGLDSLQFSPDTLKVQITFPASLDTDIKDSIDVEIISKVYGGELIEQLTETENDNKIFQDITGNIILDMSISPPQFNDAIEERVKVATTIVEWNISQNILLIEEGNNSLIYDNIDRALATNLEPQHPYNLLFYTRFFAPEQIENSVPVTLSSSADIINNMPLYRTAQGVYQSTHIFTVPEDVIEIPVYADIDLAQALQVKASGVNEVEASTSSNSKISKEPVKPAIVLSTVAKSENYGNNRDNAQIGQKHAGRALNKMGFQVKGYQGKLGDEKVTITDIRPRELLKPENVITTYDIRKYSVFYISCHGKAQIETGNPPKNEFAGLSLCQSIKTDDTCTYDPPQVTVEDTENRAGIFFAYDLKAYRITWEIEKKEIPKYKFVFLDCCLSADNNNFNPAAEEQNYANYEAATGVEDMIYGFNTYAYMGWEARTEFESSKEFTIAFFEELAKKSDEDTGEKPMSLRRAYLNALDPDKHYKVSTFPVKQKIKLLINGKDVRDPAMPEKDQKYSIDLR